MSRCFALATTAVLFLLTTPCVASAQDLPDRIRSYFPGKWENKGGANGDGGVTWELVADGKVVAGPGFAELSGATFGMGGWRVDEKVWRHSWFEGNGGNGMSELSRFENGTYFGKTRTVKGDGTESSGEFQIVVKDKDHFTIKVISKDKTSTVEWTRVKQ